MTWALKGLTGPAHLPHFSEPAARGPKFFTSTRPPRRAGEAGPVLLRPGAGRSRIRFSALQASDPRKIRPPAVFPGTLCIVHALLSVGMQSRVLRIDHSSLFDTRVLLLHWVVWS